LSKSPFQKKLTIPNTDRNETSAVVEDVKPVDIIEDLVLPETDRDAKEKLLPLDN
jgi:hypothetical protein